MSRVDLDPLPTVLRLLMLMTLSNLHFTCGIRG